MKNVSFLLLIIGFLSCKTDKKLNKKPIQSNEEILVETLTYETLKPLLNKKDDKIYIINFWATWCQPCVEELPYFEKIYKKYKEKNVELLLVSLDFPNQIEKQVIPFIKNNNIQGKVVLMADPDQNTWIPKVSKQWSGALPATIIYNKNKSAFFEKTFTYKTLETELLKFLKQD